MLHRFPPLLCLLFALIVLTTSCGTRPSRSNESKAVAASIAAAAAVPDTAAAGLVDPSAIAAAYSHRLRLGLGSPYRLIEFVLRDERLGPHRGAVARALLDQMERGVMYEITPLALMAAGVPEANAIAQLELIRQAIEGTPDPRAGELAVTLAYELAAAEKTVTPELVARVARIAALLRDRQLAAKDLNRLRDGARRRAVAPENLVLAWRSERAFTVEQPTLMPLGAAAQEEAARLALLLVGGIRSAAMPVASTLLRTLSPASAGLGQAVIAGLAHDSTERLPQNGLVITLRSIRAGTQGARTRLNEPHWEPFFERALDEERFVTELASARRSADDDVVAAGIALDVAVSLRPFAQERIGPAATSSVQDIATRFGVRVRFDTRVSEAERARSLRVLARSLEDLRTVVRTIDLTGLTFRIGPLDPLAPHLAYHEPRTRVIHLDPATMAGTIAHEIGHDLDWQLATRRYKTRSQYATDYAIRNNRSLAYAVNNLVATAAPMNKPSLEDPGANRPAEIFARRFEWYVASALAQRGRRNGYLSSAQNDWIAGYGAAVRPDPAASAAKSFAAILADATSMDRAEAAAVERIVTESTPVAVRVLARANRSADQATFERLSMAEVAEWECGRAWQGTRATGTSMRWFVKALSNAAYQPSFMALIPAETPEDPPSPRSDLLDLVGPVGTPGGACATLIGSVVF